MIKNLDEQDLINLNNSLYSNIKVKKDKIIIDYKYIVPNKMFPLNDNRNIEVFYNENTEEIPLTDIDIKKLINSIKRESGRCYSKTNEILIKAKELQLENIEAYAGWLVVVGSQLIHHSWIVYKGKHIIDINNLLEINELNKIHFKEHFSAQEYRQKALNIYKNSLNKNNSEVSVYGKVPNGLIYIGCKCEPNYARQIFNNMYAKFPNHPFCDNINKQTGKSKLQEMICEENKRR